MPRRAVMNNVRLEMALRFFASSYTCIVLFSAVCVTAVRHGERNAPVQAAAGPARSQGRPEVIEGGYCAFVLYWRILASPYASHNI